MGASLRMLLRFKMAYRQVRSGIGGVLLSVVAIGLGVGLVVGVRQMNGVVLKSFMETMDAMGGRAALRVIAGEGATFGEDIAEKVGGVAGVKLAVPLVSGIAFPDDDSGELLTVHGVDVTEDAAVRVYEGVGKGEESELVEDPLEFIAQADSILLGEEFAGRRGIEVGDGMNLVTPVGVRQFKVRGLLKATGVGRVLGGRLVVMDLYAAERVFTGDGRINQVDVVLGEGEKVSEVRERIKRVLPEGLRVEEGWERKEIVRRSVGGFAGMLSGFSLLAVLAGFVIVYNRLGAIFEGRTWQVGLFRTAGVRRSVVVWELVKESVLVGVVGSLVGVVIGEIIGRAALPVLAETVALNFRVPVVVDGEGGVDVWAVVFGLVVGVAASGLAAVVPAVRVGGRQPVAALRWRGRDLVVGGEVRMHWWLRLGVLVAAGVLVVVQRMTGWVWVGNVTTGLVAAGGCLLALPLVVASGRPLGLLLERVFGPEGRFAGVHMRSSPRRAGAGVIILAAGLGAVLLFATLGKSFEESVVDSLKSAYRAPVVATSVYTSGGYMEAPLREGILPDLLAIPGVAAVAGLRQLEWHQGARRIGIIATDKAHFSDPRLGDWTLLGEAMPDAIRLVAQGVGILASPSFQSATGTTVGDTVTLDTPVGPQPFLLAGVTNGLSFSSSRGVVIMSRERYRGLWGDPMVNRIHVALGPRVSADAVRSTIARRLGRKYRLRLLSGRQMVGYYAGEVRRAFSLQYLGDLIVLVLVLVGVGDAMAAGVLERIGQFGVMRGVGVRGSSLAWVVALEAIGAGLLGLFIALGVALVLGLFWVNVQFPALVGYMLRFHFPYVFAGVVGLLALVTCLLGAVIPSTRAAKVSVRDALRHE